MLKAQRSSGLLTIALLVGAAALASSCSSEGPRHGKPPLDGGTSIAVESVDGGDLQIKREGRTLVVDLAQEISGCTGRLYDRSVNEEYESAVSVEIVDETEKAPYTYLLLLASAPPNCNVQGECGAGDADSTLIWLKLTEDLSLAGKQAVVIEDCRAGRSVANAKDVGHEGESVGLRAEDLQWIGDALHIDVEELAAGSLQRLIYDRRNPDAGLRGAAGRSH